MNESVAEILLKPVQRALDAGVRYSTTAEALCARLEGKSLQLQAGPDNWAAWFIVQAGRLELKHGRVDAPDAVVSGSLVNLARMSLGDAEAIVRKGDVSISGDTDVADDFRSLLEVIRPNPEEEVAKFTGDPLAHELGRVFRGVRNWSQRSRRSFGRSVSEYLTEESRDLVANAELEEFFTDVDELSLAVERADAKLTMLKQQSDKHVVKEPR